MFDRIKFRVLEDHMFVFLMIIEPENDQWKKKMKQCNETLQLLGDETENNRISKVFKIAI